MAVDLKKWKQRNAAERVKAALTRPKKDNTGELLRRRFSAAADKAVEALNAKGRHPWLKYGFNEDVVVTAKLGSKVIAVTGDESIALQPSQAKAYLKDIVEATKAGQLDRELLAAAGATAAPQARSLQLKKEAVVDAPKPANVPAVDRAPVRVARAPMQMDLRAER